MTSSINQPTYQRPSWIEKGEKYVQVDNYTATLHPAIQQHVASSDVITDEQLTPAELDSIQKAVQLYNSLPFSQRANQPSTSLKELSVSGQCTGTITGPYYYWWGFAYTFNHCLISQLWVLNYPGAEAAAIGLICDFASAGLCALVEGGIGLAILSYVALLQGADSACNNRGANLDFSWGGGLPIVSQVC